MIKFSINTHRGCFGGCSFCTIAAHQGKHIQSRSERSILEEIERLNSLQGFAGNISDLGAPTANMYGMCGNDLTVCQKCFRKSCLFPKRCPNLNNSHRRLIKLYKSVSQIKGIRNLLFWVCLPVVCRTSLTHCPQTARSVKPMRRLCAWGF